MFLAWSTALICQPLSGTYSVGGAGASYSTPAAAASAVTANGVNGPVIFDIAPGIYTESMLVGPIQGTSAINTVVFQSTIPDSNSVTITVPAGSSAATNYALRLSGASFVSFRYLNFQRTGTSDYSQVVDIINGSQYVNFYHNRFTGTTATTSATYKSVIYSQNSSSQSNIVFNGNRFENGSYGLWHLGISQLICCIDQGMQVINNEFSEQSYCGVMLSYCSGPLISQNTIQSASTVSGYGIYTFFCDNNLRITRNKVAIINGRGIYVHNTTIAGIPTNLIANNFVAVGGTSASEGIFLDNSKSCHTYFNSVHLYNTHASGSAFRINGISSGFNELYNNQLVNSGGGYALYVTSTTTTPFNSSNYNNLFTSGSNTAYWQSAGNQATLANYRTASNMEQQSISMDPLFLSPTDLHCNTLLMNNLGTSSISSATPVTDDIDGDTRNPYTPDIGADEFLTANLAVVHLDTMHSLCEAGIPAILVSIANQQNVAFSDSVLITFQFTGFPFQSAKYMLNIPPQDTVQVTVSGNAPLPPAGVYNLTVFLAYPEDSDHANDTLQAQVQTTIPFTVDLGADFTLCADASLQIIPAGGPFSTYLWHDSTIASSWFANGNTLSAGIHQVTLLAHNDRGCKASDTLLMNVAPLPQPHIAVTPSFIGYIGTDTLTVICRMFTSVFSCGNFASYHWHNGSQDSTFLLMPNTLAVGHYQVHVTVTNAEGCSSNDTIAFYLDECQTVEEFPANGSLHVYPNPSSSGMFFLEIGEDMHPSQLRIFNIQGDLIDSQTIDPLFTGLFPLDLTTHSQGMYLLQLFTSKGSVSMKLIIE